MSAQERVAGTYHVDKDGQVKLAVPPTQDHPEGNTARDASGGALDAPAEPANPAAANVKPIPRRPAQTTDGEQR